MPKVAKEEIEKYQVEIATITEYPSPGSGFWKGPWSDDIYDNRSECWRENQRIKMISDRAASGQNEWGRTPEQEANFQRRLKESKELKEKARVAEEMAANVGLSVKKGR